MVDAEDDRGDQHEHRDDRKRVGERDRERDGQGEREVPGLARLVLERREVIAGRMVAAIFANVPEYRALATREDVFEHCLALVGDVFGPLAAGEHGRDARLEVATRIGQRRARGGIPLAAVMDAFNNTVQVMWDELADTATEAGTAGPAALAAASTLLTAQERVVRAAMAAYRDQMRQQIRSEEQRRSALVQALLEGTLDGTSLWEAADLLQLPHAGPYVVIAARVPDAGQHALPQIESGLEDLGIDSAWRLMHDVEIGVASLPRPTDQLEHLVEALHAGGGRVGVSPPYDDLRATAQALRLARIALHGALERRQVVVFGQDPLTSAAATDQDVMARIARTVLAGLDELPEGDRELLLSTFGAWLDNAGSAEETGKQLFVHPNTVRYRLRRLEERTGRLLSDPRRAAELSLAYEIDRREKVGKPGADMAGGYGWAGER